MSPPGRPTSSATAGAGCRAAAASFTAASRSPPQIVALAAPFGAGCGDDDPTASRAEVIEHYAAGVHASYETSLASARRMDTAIDAFVEAPSSRTLRAARVAWIAARDDDGRTEAFRFYGGPIDNDETGREGEINAWPLG
ncbi:MAG: hypothetical protein H6531_04500 [Actinobacteria bacterium]|nr:hypothetical protein [Actinomycetota bacterium]